MSLFVISPTIFQNHQTFYDVGIMSVD